MKEKLTLDEKINAVNEKIEATEKKIGKLNDDLKQLAAKKERLEQEKRLNTFTEAEVVLAGLGTDMSVLIEAIQSGKVDISTLKSNSADLSAENSETV